MIISEPQKNNFSSSYILRSLQSTVLLYPTLYLSFEILLQSLFCAPISYNLQRNFLSQGKNAKVFPKRLLRD